MNFVNRKLYLRFISWVFLCNAVLFCLIGFSYLQSITSSTTLFQNLVFDCSGYIGRFFVAAFLVTCYFSYMFFLAFIPAILVLFLSFLFPYKKFVFSIAIIVFALALLFLAVDVRVFSIFKFHLNKPILQILFTFGIQNLLDLSSYEMKLLFLIASALFILECVILWLVWKALFILERFWFGKGIFVVWIGAALFSYFSLMLSLSVQHNNLLIQHAANLPYYNNFLALLMPQTAAKQALNRYSENHYMQAQFATYKLNYPRELMRCDVSRNKPYNIIFIMVDSLRYDILQYMPSVTRFAEQNWHFLRHYSGGNSTQAGLFSLFYSIPSSYWSAALEQQVAPVFIQQLLANNYLTAVYWASEMHNPPMHKTIYNKLRGLELDAVKADLVSDWDRETTKKSLTFLELAQKSDQPFFLNIFYNAPHAFCRTQDLPPKYKPTATQCSRLYLNNSSDPRPLFNSYLNSVDFIDKEISKVLQKIAESSLLDNSIVIITSDHGQEFNDNRLNYWWHAGNYTDYQVRVPMIVHWPRSSARKVSDLTSHYDVMPTILQRAFNCKNPVKHYSVGKDLLSGEQAPFLIAGSYVNNCIIEQDRLTTLHRSGEITVTNRNLQPLNSQEINLDVLNEALQILREFY